MILKERTIKLGKAFQLGMVFLILGLVASVVHRSLNNVDIKHYIMGSDMQGYYQYLPTFFLEDWANFERLPYAKQFENGKTLNAYTCGVAIMQAPFFLAAHSLSLLFQMETSNGYSSIYFFFVFFAALFYAYLGLLFVYKTLTRHFDSKVSFWTAALIFFATNLFYYTIFSPGMSHVYSFCLIAAFIYFVPNFYEKPSVASTLKVAIPLALATLIRPTNIVIGFYWLLFAVDNWNSFKVRISWLVANWKLVALMVITGIAIFLPQMAYWYKVTGKIFYYSYQSEGFPYLTNPQIGTVLWGARNGWFIYTPLMLVASLSLILLAFKNKFSARWILLPTLIIIYINASWWVPTFSAAAGYRALIEFIPFMAIPLAFFITKTINFPTFALRKGVVFLLGFFVVYNILFSYKFNSWLWWDTPWDWNYLIRVFTFQ